MATFWATFGKIVLFLLQHLVPLATSVVINIKRNC